MSINIPNTIQALTDLNYLNIHVNMWYPSVRFQVGEIFSIDCEIRDTERLDNQGLLLECIDPRSQIAATIEITTSTLQGNELRIALEEMVEQCVEAIGREREKRQDAPSWMQSESVVIPVVKGDEE